MPPSVPIQARRDAVAADVLGLEEGVFMVKWRIFPFEMFY